MKLLTSKEVMEETKKMDKIFLCYQYLVNNCADEAIRKQIEEIGRQHLIFNLDRITCSASIPVQARLRELEDRLKELAIKNQKSKTIFDNSTHL